MRDSRFYRNRQGMTLLEVLVTLGALSVLFAGTLTVYSVTYKNFRTRNSLLQLVHDSDLVMSVVGRDIRRTHEFLENYEDNAFGHIVAAMKITHGEGESLKERLIIYSLDAEHPNRLLRSAYSEGEDEIISTEVSRHIQSFKIVPQPEKVFDIHLTVKDDIAGKELTLQTLSSYAMRY